MLVELLVSNTYTAFHTSMQKYSTHKLSDPEVRHAKAHDSLYRLRDGGGLSCDILPSGGKVWRYAYRFNAKQKTFTIGNYPAIGLSEARKRRDEAKDKIKSGIDPSLERQTLRHTRHAASFQAIAEAWYASNRAGWSLSHATRMHSYLVRDVFPVMGSMDVQSITAPTIILIVKTVADRGAVDAAKRVKGFIQQVFDYALVHGQIDRNPARDINLSLILPKTIKKHFAAITQPAQIGELLRAIEDYSGGTLSVKAALRLSPLLFLRPTELREAKWAEVDLGKAVWILPARRRKLPTHLKKADRLQDALTIPLSRQAVAILSHLYEYTGRGQYLFPSTKGTSRAISNNAVRTALRIMGYTNDDMTAHGFRGLASTRLNEMGYRSEVIEAQLGHKEKDEIRAAYNRADYLAERTAMMQAWADYLEGLRHG